MKFDSRVNCMNYTVINGSSVPKQKKFSKINSNRCYALIQYRKKNYCLYFVLIKLHSYLIVRFV